MTFQNKRILVADDSLMMREELISFLNKMNISNIEKAENGKEAVEILKNNVDQENKFNLILLDINMPGFTGIQVLKLLRTIETYKNTHVLMVSTENEKEIVLEAIVSGANDYILKPFNYESFKQKIMKYLTISEN